MRSQEDSGVTGSLFSPPTVPFVLPALYGAVISVGLGKAVQGGFLSRQSSRWRWGKIASVSPKSRDRPLIYKVMNNYVRAVLVCIRCAGLCSGFPLPDSYMNIHERRGGVALGGTRGGAPGLALARSRGDGGGGGGGSSGHWRPGA